MSISIAAQIHKGYVYHVSSYVSIKLFQMKKVLIVPAMVTMIPAERSTQTPMRCLRGMLRRMIAGMGKRVHCKSAMQLMMPHVSVMMPSSKHCPSMTLGNCQ